MARTHRYLLYELTKSCQNDCAFCYNVWKEPGEYPPEELEPRESLALLEKVITETGCKFIGLTGGEPMLRDDVFDIASFVSRRGVLPVLITNGMLLSRENVAALMKCGVNHFEISLHGHEPRVHDALARREGSFEEVVEAVLNVKGLGGQVNTVFVATKSNIGAFKEYVELNALLKVDWILFNRVACGGNGIGRWAELAPSPAEIMTGLDAGAPAAEKYRIGISAGVQVQPCLIDLSRYKNVPSAFCPLNAPSGESSYFAIDPAGNLRMCNRSRIILGNLLREPFAAIAEGPVVESFCGAVPEFCRGCRLARECAGGCKADAFACYGDLERPDPYLELWKAEARKIT